MQLTVWPETVQVQPGTAGGGGKESGRDRVDQGDGADGRHTTVVGRNDGVRGAAVPLCETPGVALRNTEVLAAVDRGEIRLPCYSTVLTSPPPAIVRYVGHGCGRVGLDVHPERDRGIARASGQRVTSRAGHRLRGNAARPAHAAHRRGNQTGWDIVDQGDGTGGRRGSGIGTVKV